MKTYNKDYQKKYHKKHKKEFREYSRKHEKTKKGKLTHKKYYENHKSERIEYQKQYIQKRYNEDMNFRLRVNLRSRLYQTIRGKYRSKTLPNIMNCTIEQLIQYLTDQFDFNMTWENYGKYWEIDHIKPCASFDLSKSPEQKKCFHYSNLQPLEVSKNRSKNNNIWRK